MAEVLTSSGFLALLDEPEQALRLYALQMLNQVVHQFWFEIAGSLAAVEAQYEDETFEHQNLAALVASKVCTQRTIAQWSMGNSLGCGTSGRFQCN